MARRAKVYPRAKAKGRAVIVRRAELAWSAHDLAERLGVSTSYVTQIGNGLECPLEVAERIASVLGRPTESLFDVLQAPAEVA